MKKIKDYYFHDVKSSGTTYTSYGFSAGIDVEEYNHDYVELEFFSRSLTIGESPKILRMVLSYEGLYDLCGGLKELVELIKSKGSKKEDK